MTCPYSPWLRLGPDHRARLRMLPAYLHHRDRLDHLADRPRCRACKETA